MADTKAEDTFVGNVDVIHDDLQERSGVNEESPHEIKARESGWVPLDEWTNDEADWVDAKQFNFRGELMDRIQSQTRANKAKDKKIDDLTNAVKQLGEHNRKMGAIEYEKAIKALRAERRDAMQSGEDTRVDEIEDTLDQLKDAKKEMDQGVLQENDDDIVPQGFQDAFEDFIADNDWYGKDEILRAAADAIGEKYLAQGLEPDQVFKNIKKDMTKKFPNDFGKANKQVAAVDDSSGDGTSRQKAGNNRAKSKYTARDLTPNEKQMAKVLVESGAMKDMQTWVDQYAEAGGFEGDRI